MPEELHLRSEHVQEILTAIPNWMIRWGNTLVFLIIIMLLSITYFIKYPDVITTEALITTEVPLEKIYAPNSSRIAALLVEDKMDVHTQTALAVLENTADYKAVFQLHQQVDSVGISFKQPRFPVARFSNLRLGDIAPAFALFEKSYEEYQLQQQLTPFENEYQTNTGGRQAAAERLQILERQKELNEQELALLQIDLERNEYMFKEGMIAEIELEKARQQFIQVNRSFESIKLSISQLRENQHQLEQGSKAISIRQAQEEAKLLKNVIHNYIALQKALDEWDLKNVLRSSIKGQVIIPESLKNKQRLQANELLFTLLPSDQNNYIARLKAPIQNSGKLKIKQKVNIQLQNYPETEFGRLKATVDHIALLPNEEGYYLIEVQLPQRLITSYNKEISFRQEMKGTAEIITEDLRLIERFFYQFKEVLRV